MEIMISYQTYVPHISHSCSQRMQVMKRTVSSPRLSGFLTSRHNEATLKPDFRCRGALALPDPCSKSCAELPTRTAAPLVPAAATLSNVSPGSVGRPDGGICSPPSDRPPRRAAHTASTLALCCALRSSLRAPACCFTALMRFFCFFAGAVWAHFN